MGNATKNQIFDKTARLTNHNSNFVADDVQSQKVIKSKPEPEPCSPLLAKALAKVDLKGSLRVERLDPKPEEKAPVEEQKVLSKAQKKILKRQKKRMEQERAQQAKEPVVEEAKPTEDSVEIKEAVETEALKPELESIETSKKQDARVSTKAGQPKDSKV